MVTAKGTSVGDKRCAPDRQADNWWRRGLHHNQNYSRGLRETLPFARNYDNG